MKTLLENSKRSADAIAAEALVLFLGSGEKLPRTLDAAARARLEAEIARESFQGGAKELLVCRDGQRWTVLVGLGDKKYLTVEQLRLQAASAGRRLLEKKVKSIAFALPSKLKLGVEEGACAVALGLLMSGYKFERYITDPKKHVSPPERVIGSLDGEGGGAKAGFDRARSIAAGMTLARDLVNEPAEVATPTYLAQAAQRVAREGKLGFKRFDKRELERQRMGALLAVARGSDTPPAMVQLSYKPAGKAKGRLAFVGKGVTFDTGGYDIKGADSMLDMKCDMAGAAAVIGAMKTISMLRPAYEVHGLFGAVENMISGRAYRPGDILTTRRGKTVEVNNTDAEGRLVLADVLDYVCTEIKPDLVIDLATLTGACVVALGPQCSGVMSNDDDAALRVLTAARHAGEKMWRLPLIDEYLEQLKSSVADMKNTGSRYGGALTAGLFLREFVREGQPWVHLDIAGPAFADSDNSFWGKGGTGAGVHTLVSLTF